MPLKSSRAETSSGRDIRNLFGGSQPSHKDTQQKITKGTREGDAIEISDDDDKHEIKSHTPKSPKASLSRFPPQKQASNLHDDDRHEQPKPSMAKKRKKPSILLSSDEEDEPSPENGTPVAMPLSSVQVKTSRIKKARISLPDHDYEMKNADEDNDEDDLIPTTSKEQALPSTNKTVRKEPLADLEAKAEGAEITTSKPKFNWAAARAAKAAGPSAPGSKAVPEPASMNCLANLSFVFTGELSSFSRDEAIELAKRFGGRVVGQPSSKTSFVVLGDNAGPSKLAAIEKHGLKTLNEDEFLNLIATRVVKDKDLDANTKKRMEKERAAIREAAQEMENREKGKGKEAGSSGPVDSSSRLWTVRYAPQSLKEICGNKGQIEKLRQWLHDWPQNLKCDFKKPGKSGMNVFRAVMITGLPGIGKTTSAQLVAKLEGFTVIELNASDARNKKLIENSLNINNTTLNGWLGGGHQVDTADIVGASRPCIIMDEVDGMSAGDRGGVGAINALIKKTKVPIICIANDRGAQKLRPLMNTTYSLPFRKPDVATIRSRILSIAYKEKMKIPSNVVDQLIEGSQSDIRQVINMLSTWKLSHSSMDFDEGKKLVKMNEKYSIMTPFEVTHKVLGPYLFSPSARETLSDKMEMYFHDYSFVPLFIQENYLKTQPARLRNMSGPEQSMKALELMDKAASSISDGDLVDALIHGPEQHWTLMPLHAVCSTVRPASFVYGACSGYGGPKAISFPQWLGRNSKQSKLTRQLRDLQIRMRLKVSGNPTEIRQSYLPAMFPHLVKPLVDNGVSAVPEVIQRMDDYYLSKEDWDALVELGVDQNKDDLVLKKISSATKTNFTKKYNSTEHPIPYHKAQDLGKAPKKVAAQSVPDLEEAFDIDDVADESDDGKNGKKSDDVLNDTLIQVPKKKGKSKDNTEGKKRK